MSLDSAKQITLLLDTLRLKVRDKLIFLDTETLTATTAVVSVEVPVTMFDTTLGASTTTLAAGEEGQLKICYMKTDGGDQVLTPASLGDGTTITFDANDVWIGIYVEGAWRSLVASATVA